VPQAEPVGPKTFRLTPRLHQTHLLWEPSSPARTRHQAPAPENGRLLSGAASGLDAFSPYPQQRGCPAMPYRTTGKLEAAASRSSRTWDPFPSKPSSRSLLIGEQPHPWPLMQGQDRKSRHRGTKPRGRCGLSPATSLLSPG